MGFLSRFQTAFHFTKFQQEIFMPAFEESLRSLDKDSERFEQFSYTWKKILTDHPKQFLASCGDHIIKYYAIWDTSDIGLELIEAHLARMLIPNFAELPAAKRAEEQLGILLMNETNDDGIMYDTLFRQQNPRSAEYFKQIYGATPFDKEMRAKYSNIAAGRG